MAIPRKPYDFIYYNFYAILVLIRRVNTEEHDTKVEIVR